MTSEALPDIECLVHDEFNAAQSTAAIVDRSALGKLLLSGADKQNLLQRLSTNDLSGLGSSSALSTVFTTEKGRIIDCVRLLSLRDSFLLMTSPGRENQLKMWIEKYIVMEDVRVNVVTNDFAAYSLIGPEAIWKGGLIFEAGFENGDMLERKFATTDITIDVQKDHGGTSLNILVSKGGAADVWQELQSKGGAAGVRAMGGHSYECFRIFHGIPFGGTELTIDFNPYEVRLGHLIDFTKGCYIGQEVIARLDTYDKIQRNLVRLEFRGLPQDLPSSTPLFKAGDKVGLLTSISPVPIKGCYFALGVLGKGKVTKGDELCLLSQPSDHKGIVTEIFEWKRG